MNRLRKRKIKLLSAGVLLLGVLLGNQTVWAKIYSVQLGVFQKYSNADRQFNQLKKSLPSNLSDHLRVEKTGKDYIIKVGKLEELEQAVNLLTALKDYYPDAFIWKGDWVQEKILTTQKNPIGSAEPPAREEKVPAPEGKKNEAPRQEESALQINQTILYGTILEIRSMTPEQLGLPPGKIVYRLVVRVEETKEIKGFPDFLKEKKGQPLTLFSETSPAFFKAGNKISAVAEYRGNRFSRFYWINHPHAVKP
jgi:hypothetical protein